MRRPACGFGREPRSSARIWKRFSRGSIGPTRAWAANSSPPPKPHRRQPVTAICASVDMTRVLIADNLSPRAVGIFKERGIEADVKIGLKEPELIGVIDGYDGLA